MSAISKKSREFVDKLNGWELAYGKGELESLVIKLVHKKRRFFQIPIAQIYKHIDAYFWIDHLSEKAWATDEDLEELAEFFDFYLATSRNAKLYGEKR
ncbi:MAG: hypothetical protein KME28_20375 [Pelatocladus maniniholoensis HA4357-MV3]|jgi:hypothetical protein|uniref:Uncharacterized protein n=1 Tax=Pelatocladus maniniholoensis HA4357-MV3 TaxID=1117104 RepID=A0A9E3HC12_9NOST|nr:hypothetical protein [Pelatocladus maniniholoensis HA4357-MV3]